MSYWSKSSDPSKGKKQSGPAPVLQEKSGGLPTASTVRKMIKGMMPSATENEFYEMEMGEVINVILKEPELPDLKDGGGKDWSKFGAATVRLVNSEYDSPLSNIGTVRPLFPNSHPYPMRGEYVVVVKFNEQNFYINVLNLFDNVNNNISPGFSGVRPEDIVEEDFIYEHFEPDLEIRNLWPHQGDSILQGRWGNSIRLGSHIIPGSHGDGIEKPDSPNILLRTGQLVDATAFGKDGVVQDLKNTPKKPVEEDINADGSSIWMTTDQSIKLNIKGSNALSHDYMTSLQSDDQPKNGGKQIVLNSDRITFNTKQGKILGFSHDGIGFSTQKTFSVDADDGMKMNSGGATSMDMVPGGISLITPGNSRLDLGGGGEDGDADKIYLSSECPSFLTLDDKAHLQSCEGAVVHLDDCAGMKDNQGSFIRIGGKAQGITGYVKGRDDMKQQHLVYGEALTDILDELITSILNITAIPTGAGPSGPISATPSVADFESIRAKLCDLLMKPS
jgi:hypothetical protein